MKKSNLLLLILSVVFLTGIFATDRVLVIQYKKTNLGDPYKNFEPVNVMPFKAIKISGGNGYAIRIQKAGRYDIRLRNSRKDFFKMKMLLDTLVITFTVANQNYQQQRDVIPGLIISAPAVSYLDLSGTNNEITLFSQDSLTIRQNANTFTRLNSLNLGYLKLIGTTTSYFDLESANHTKHLHLDISNNAVANLGKVDFDRFTTNLQDSSAIIMHKNSMEVLRNNKAD